MCVCVCLLCHISETLVAGKSLNVPGNLCLSRSRLCWLHDGHVLRLPPVGEELHDRLDGRQVRLHLRTKKCQSEGDKDASRTGKREHAPEGTSAAQHRHHISDWHQLKNLCLGGLCDLKALAKKQKVRLRREVALVEAAAKVDALVLLDVRVLGAASFEKADEDGTESNE